MEGASKCGGEKKKGVGSHKIKAKNIGVEQKTGKVASKSSGAKKIPHTNHIPLTSTHTCLHQHVKRHFPF